MSPFPCAPPPPFHCGGTCSLTGCSAQSPQNSRIVHVMSCRSYAAPSEQDGAYAAELRQPPNGSPGNLSNLSWPFRSATIRTWHHLELADLRRHRCHLLGLLKTGAAPVSAFLPAASPGFCMHTCQPHFCPRRSRPLFPKRAHGFVSVVAEPPSHSKSQRKLIKMWLCRRRVRYCSRPYCCDLELLEDHCSAQ